MTAVRVMQGDITKLEVQAIVNAANNSLLGGGGVDGAIHRAGGKEIVEECRRIGGCDTGDAVITGAGKLPCSYVIHTVGPVWYGGTLHEQGLLSSCYQRSLQVALDQGIKSIAFPNISTGVYGYPKKAAAENAVQTVQQFISERPEAFESITFVCFDKENLKLYEEMLTP